MYRRCVGAILNTLYYSLSQGKQYPLPTPAYCDWPLCFKQHRPPRPRSPDAPTRRGRWPSPRRPRAGSPTRVSAATPDGPTPARCGAWTPGGGPPRSPTPCSPPTSARSSRRAARPPPPPWPSPPSGFGPSSPAKEYALSAVVEGRVRRFILDRTFVDGGTRWIIDYKTGTHTGSDLDRFLENEQARYRAQLEGYASVIQTLDARPIRLGLYFPMLQGWREWPFVDQSV